MSGISGTRVKGEHAILRPVKKKALLRSAGLHVTDLDLLLQALSLYHEKNIDFADALLAGAALGQGLNIVYSFDKHFGR